MSQDVTYQLDPDFVYVEIPDKFEFDPTNIVVLSGQTSFVLNGKTDGVNTTITGGNILPLTVKLRKKLDKDVSVRLVVDNELLSEYPFEKVDYTDFPSDTYELPDITIKAGETQQTVELTFTDINKLNNVPGYLLPLRLELIETGSDLIVSTVSYSVFIRLDMIFTNIDSSNAEIPGTAFNATVTFASNRTTGLANLKDGNITGGIWYPNNADTYLEINLPEEETIKGIRINTVTGTYQLASFNVLARQGERFVSHGPFAINSQTTVLHVKFIVPVTTKSIRLENLRSLTNSTQPDLTEINLIK